VAAGRGASAGRGALRSGLDAVDSQANTTSPSRTANVPEHARAVLGNSSYQGSSAPAVPWGAQQRLFAAPALACARSPPGRRQGGSARDLGGDSDFRGACRTYQVRALRGV
jgi:hypothetical protein